MNLNESQKPNKVSMTRRIVFAILPGLIVAGLIFSANTYYDLDLQRVIIDEIQTVTKNIYPATTTQYTLGSQTYKWANIYSATGTFGETITIGTNTITGTGTTTISTEAGSLILTPLANVGIGISTPTTKLTVYDTGTQLRLSYSDSYYSDFSVDGGGNLRIDPTGGIVSVRTDGTQNYFRVYSTSTDYVQLTHSGTAGLLQVSAGNIEIGSSESPIYLEEITFISASSSTSTLTITQSGTGDIVEFKDSTTTVFAIQDGGNVVVSEINNTIYVDGTKYTQDSAGIQNAIDDLPSTGGKVILPEGTYNVDRAMDSAIAYDADDATPYDDETTAANNTTTDDMTLLPASPAVNDAYYFGWDYRSRKLTLNISTAGVGTWTITWEYWNGSSWTALSNVTDNTSGFTASSTNDVTYDLPSDWAKTTVNGVEKYFIRARVSDFTSITTQPKGAQAYGHGSIIIDKSYVTLEGVGESSKIYLTDNANVTVIQVGDGLNSYEGITIANLQIDGNRTNQTTGHGIYLTANVTKSKVDKVHVKSVYFDGIHTFSASNCIISNNILRDNGNNGIHLDSGSFMIVVGNDVQDTEYRGIYMSSSKSTITGNTVNNSGWMGIAIENGSNNTISGNTSYSNGWAGIDLRTTNHNTITANNSYLNDLQGIYISKSSYNIISSNTLKDNSQDGSNSKDEIFLTGDASTYSTYNIIEGNNIYTTNGRYGICENSSNDDYNTITNNTIIGPVSGAIYAQGPHTTVAGNKTSDTTEGLFQITTTASSTQTALTITQSGTGEIVEFKDGGTTVFKIADGGNVTVAGNILPATTTTYDLGSDTYKWANIYAATGTFGSTITIGSHTLEGSATTTLFTTGNSNQLVLGANGNVGIGTANPLSTLDVRGTIENGLVAWWSMDEGTGTTTTDQSINSNTGILGGDGTGTDLPTWTNGKFGKALSFDGEDDYVEVPDSESLNITDAITIEAWVKPVTFSSDFLYHGIVEKGTTETGGYGMHIYGGTPIRFQFWTYGGAGYKVASVAVPSFNTWHHVVGVFDGSNNKIYINGVESDSQTGGAPSDTSGSRLKIGYAHYHTYLNGTIDEVRIYNRALSPREIAEHYRQKAPSLAQGGTISDSSAYTALTVTQSGTGDIVNLYDSSYKVFQVADGGNITAWRNATLTGGNLTVGPLSPPSNLSVATSSSSGSCATGTTYYYRVTAVNPNGETLGCTEVSTSTGDATALEVSWSAVAGATGYKVYRATSSISNGDLVTLVDNTTKTTTSFTDDCSGDATSTIPSSNTTGGNLAINTNTLYVDAETGRVGIGTTTPASLLELYKADETKLTITSASSTDALIAFRTGATPSTQALIGIDQSDSNKLKLVRGSDIATSTGITIDSSGNVGIGTTAPLHTLDVRGDIVAPNNKVMARYLCDQYGKRCKDIWLNGWTRLAGDGNVDSNTKIASGTNGGPTFADGDYFGRSAAGIGDLNGDGVPDMVVGAIYDDTGGSNRGAVYVLFMNTDGTVSSHVKIASGTNGGPTLADSDYFGVSVAGIGDLNGDGVPDMVVGANGDDTGGSARGAVYVLFMNTDGTVSSHVKIASGTNGGPTLADSDFFGISAASIGDLNGDGVPDMVVGANGDDTGGSDRGAVYVLFMNTDGTVSSHVKIASGTNGGPTLADYDYFGRSAAGIGDLNGDGVPDMVVGAIYDDTGGTDRGAVYVLFMNTDGTVSSHVKIASGTNGGPTLADSDYFGVSVAGIGDLNGDGVPDMVVGAYRDDTGGSDRGAVYVLFMAKNNIHFANQNVGIGTTTPIAKLTVTQSGTGDIVNLYDASNKVFQVADGGNITAWRNATLTGGNLTVGPLSPPSNLSVATSSSSGSCATGTTYYYRVTAVNPNGETLGCTEVSTSTGDATALDVSWSAVAGATGYKVYRATSSISNGDLVTLVDGSATTTTSFTDDCSGDGTSTIPSANTTGGRIASHLIPLADNTYDLGSSALRWANLYAGTTTIGSTITIGSNTLEGSATTTFFTTGNSNQLVLGANGNVGIGTTTPSYKLEVSGMGSFDYIRYKKDVWVSMADTPSNVYLGGSLVYTGGDYIYALRGYNSTDFWRYSISQNSWTSMAPAPGTVDSGGSLVYTGGDYIYALRGDNSTDFWRYSISSNSWTSMAPAPGTVSLGGSLVYTGGDYIYAFRGNNYTDFWRYSISQNSWTSMADAPANVFWGASLVYTGGDYIYAFRGGNTTDFWRYSISQNSWTSMANAPANVYYGGSLVYTGGDYIYALRGYNSTDFWRYSISQNSWTSMADAPANIHAGGSLVYTGGDYIYAFRGAGTTDFWRYTVGGDTGYDKLASQGLMLRGNIFAEQGTNLVASTSNTALTVTQSGTGNIVEFKDGGITVFKIADGGNVTVAGDILPATTTTYNLGSDTYKWANIYAATGTFGSTITIGSHTFEGSATTTLFTTGNSNQLVLGANGNVGIGTAAPGWKLDVSGPVSVDNNLLTQMEGGLYYGRVRVSENQWALSNVGATWTERTGAGLKDWQSVSLSSDGKYQTAVVYGGYIYTSSDYGATWTERTGAGSRNWYSVSLSSDGKYQTAVVYGGYIYTSSDYGATWTERTGAGSRLWLFVSLSSDGKYQTAVVYGLGYIYTSSDYGATWTERTGAGSRDWSSVSLSSDGKYQTAVALGGYIYTSSDYGATWTERTGAGSRSWWSVSLSSDGKYQTAVVYGGYIYTSSDYGATWTERTGAGSRNWYSVSLSSDGKYQTAVAYGGYIYTSSADSYIYGGNVGIGTTTPNYLLEVAGQTGITANTSSVALTVTQSGTGEIIDLRSGATSVFTLTSADRLKLRDGLLTTFGGFNDQILDDFEDGDISNWTSSDSSNTTLATTTSAKVNDIALTIQTTVGTSTGDVATTTPSVTDWSSYERLGFWIKAEYTTTSTDATTTQIISVQENDAGGTHTHNITIQEMGEWQYEEWDISSFATDTTSWFGFRIDNDYGSPKFYIDQIRLYGSAERSSDIFVDSDGSLNILAQKEIQLTRTTEGSALPGLTVGTANVVLNQPLEVDVAGDVGIDYDLYFANTGLSTISSEGPLKISAGDANSYENLTLTTGGTGDIIMDIASSTIGFKILGSDSGGYILKLTPTGDTYIGGTGSGASDLTVKENLTLTSGNLTINQLSTPSAPTLATTTGGSCATGTTYYVRMAACNDNGCTSRSATTSINTGANGTKIRITFSSITGATYYKFWRSTDDIWDGANDYVSSTTAPNTTFYDDCSGATTSTSPTTNTTGGGLAVNTNALYVDGTTGYVGIGTTNPLSTLDVRGTIENGLVAWWSMDEGTGTTTADQSINDNTGTIHGATWTNGKFGKALSFDGVDDYVDCGDDTSLNFTSENFTITAWIDSTLSDYQGIFDRGSYKNYGYELFLYGEDIYFQTYQPDQYQSTYAIGVLSSGFHHIAVVRNGNTATIYVDGSAPSQTHGTHLDPASASMSASIGTRGPSHFFNGIIDEVRIYNRALSAREVAELYRQKAPSLAQGGTISDSSAYTALTVTQSGTGDIVNLYDSSYKVFQVADGGNITAWRNATLTGGNLTIGPLSPPSNLSVATSSSSGSCATGTTYYYRVTAVNPNGETLGCTEVSTSTGDATALDVSWSAVAGATGYKVYRATSSISNGDSVTLVDNTTKTTTSFTDDCSGDGTSTIPSSNTTGGNLAVNTNTLYVDVSNGNVGVGTTSPSEKLHISNGVATYDSNRNITDLYHLVDKKYVDEAVTALGARYYMLDDASGKADYKLCSTTPSAGGEQSVSVTNLSDGDYIQGWIAPNTNEPDKLITGVYNWRIYAEKTGGTKTLRLYWKLVERKSDDSEVVIGTSTVSDEIISGKNSYIIPLTLSEDYDIASDSYIVGKIYADVSGMGLAPGVTLYYEGNSDSHWQMSVNTEILNDVYVNINGDTMTGTLNLPTNGLVVGTDQLIVSGGYVGIGTTTPNHLLTIGESGDATSTYRLGVYGSIRATGSIDANQSFDIAESYPIDPQCEQNNSCPEIGDVVSVGENSLLEKSSIPYDEKLIGVISENPAFSIGAWNMATSSRLVALAGRVPVKVSLENGPIEVGDLLTSASSTPGTAMKATEPGRVIGIALEPFNGTTTQCTTTESTTTCQIIQSNTGQIMVFVNPHWSIGQLTEDGLLALNNSTTTASSSTEETSILDRFTLAVKSGLQKLGLFVEKGVAKVKELFAKKVVTNQICLEDKNGSTTCITKAELDRLLKERNLSGGTGAPCIPNWQCTDWSPLPGDVCAGESFTQTRTCTDLNNCGVDNGKPEETKNATGTKDCSSGNNGGSGGSSNGSGGGSGVGDNNNSSGDTTSTSSTTASATESTTTSTTALTTTSTTDSTTTSTTSTEQTETSCDNQHLDLCDNETDCVNAGGLWYDDKCNAQPKDTDGDGIIDSEDACPETAGDFCNGCPQPECSTCQSPVCPETGKPICQDDNSLCQVLPNTDVICQSGICSYSCQEGYLDCNGDGTGSDTDGCEFQKESPTSTCSKFSSP